MKNQFTEVEGRAVSKKVGGEEQRVISQKIEGVWGMIAFWERTGGLAGPW